MCWTIPRRPSVSTSYTYDRLNRVTKIEYPDQIVADEEFIYDDAGRMVLKRTGDNTRRPISMILSAGCAGWTTSMPATLSCPCRASLLT